MKGIGWLCLLLAACAPPKGMAGAREELIVRNVVEEGSLRSVLELEKGEVGRGGVLKARFSIENLSPRPVRLRFSSGQLYDFLITDLQGKEYWKWSRGRFFTMALQERELGSAPLVFEEEIPLQDQEERELPPGTYLLKAHLTAQTGLANQVQFQIREP